MKFRNIGEESQWIVVSVKELRIPGLSTLAFLD